MAIDLEKIGHRLFEERKYNAKLSQEKMAEALGMYQADISNMEKAKPGSGISDLLKLDLFAEYFNVPLETIVFGREDKNMLRYYGNQMKLKPSKKKATKGQLEILHRLTGIDENQELNPTTFECGPYMLFTMVEYQMSIQKQKADLCLPKYHTYIMLEGTVIAVMTSAYTTVMQHVFQPSLANLQMMIPGNVLDVTDVYRTLNPYWTFYRYSEEQDKYKKPMVDRMDALRQAGEDRSILYIESIYVREDNREHGIFRMYIDLLKLMFDGCIMWLNMEPTSGDELDQEYDMVPAYSVSDLGQLNINAAIAEKVGFTVDPDTWHRQAETIDSDGNVSIETVLVRKCAYYLPQEIRNILKDDGDLVLQGRALQRLANDQQSEDDSDNNSQTEIDVYHGRIDGFRTMVLMITEPGQAPYYVAAVVTTQWSKKYYVSKTNILKDKKKNGIIEEYSNLKAAESSKYIDWLRMVDSFS